MISRQLSRRRSTSSCIFSRNTPTTSPVSTRKKAVGRTRNSTTFDGLPEKGHVLPRDYTGLTSDRFETQANVVSTALGIYYSDEDDDRKRGQLLSLLSKAQRCGVEISEQELVSSIREQEEDLDEPLASYSWVHSYSV